MFQITRQLLFFLMRTAAKWLILKKSGGYFQSQPGGSVSCQSLLNSLSHVLDVSNARRARCLKRLSGAARVERRPSVCRWQETILRPIIISISGQGVAICVRWWNTKIFICFFFLWLSCDKSVTGKDKIRKTWEIRRNRHEEKTAAVTCRVNQDVINVWLKKLVRFKDVCRWGEFYPLCKHESGNNPLI